MTNVLILNPPTEGAYINRDQMGGMGQKLSFGRSLLTSFLSKMKSSFIRQSVLQLVYAASILSKSNKVLVIDALNENLDVEDVIEMAKKFNPEYTIMAISSSDIIYERDVVASKIKKETGCKIITVGDTITNMPLLFKKPFDIAVIGEIEKVIKDIVSGKSLKKIPGIIYFEDGKIKRNTRRDFLTERELEELPFPKWELFPYKKYRYYPLLFEEPAVSMLSSRGCPYACYYCSYSKNEGRKLRLRSAKNVVDEIENNLKYGIKGVVFRDPLFTGNSKRTEEICKLIINKKLDVIWACETRPELLDKKLLEIMYKAGCRAINLGVESIHEEELKAVGRGKLDKEHLKKIIFYCNKLGIRTTCFFILGLPNSTKNSMNETIDFSLMKGLNHAEYKIATPYPGTKLREIALKKGWISGKEKDLSGYNAVMQISKEITPECLNKLCDSAFKKFYFRKKWILNEIDKNVITKAGIFMKTLFRILVI